MKHSVITAGFLAASMTWAAGSSPASAAALRAGIAKIDITPTQPVTMSGYASRKDLSRGIHDPLSARAVAFEHEGKRLVLVSTDILGFYGGTCEPLRQAILDACRLEPAELFLTAIHTHAAPTPGLDGERTHPHNVEYTRWLRDQLVQVVREALGRLTPVSVGFGTGHSPVGTNRRQVLKDDRGGSRIVLGRNPELMTDREVQVLAVRELEGERLGAVLFGYATHSTSLGPANYLISGDLHGLAAQFVEQHRGGGIIAPAFAGASGDIDPWYRVLPEFKTSDGWVPEPVLLGTLLGVEVVHVLNGIRLSNPEGPVHSILRTLELPAKPAEGDAAPRTPATRPFTITVGRVGTVAVVGLGGEVFNEIGRAIKAASPFPQTLVITHCNGAAGYLVVEEAYADGGYEVQTSPFAPDAATLVRREVSVLLRELGKPG